MSTLEGLLEQAKGKMAKSVESTRHEFNSVRTGRASAALLDRIQVDAYGSKMPINQVATVSVPEPRSLSITPFDKSQIKAIERAIQESDLGLTPQNDGKVVRLSLPQLTEERRKDLVKVVRHLAEDGRVAVRNIRRDAIHHMKDLEKDGEVSWDDLHRSEDRVQKLTDEHVKQIDDLLKHKEQEILEV